MTTCMRVRRDIGRLIEAHPGSTTAVIWCPSKRDVEGLNLSDTAAKAASSLPQVIDQTPQPDAILKKIKQQLADTITAPPPRRVLDRLMGSFDPPATYKALSKLKRPDATAISQIRSGHFPLNAYLHRFKAADTPNCDLCKQRDNVGHLLTNCRKFVGLRQKLFKAAKQNKTSTNRIHLLTSPSMFEELSNFVRKSHKFYKARHRR